MEVTGLLFDLDDVLCDATMWRRWLLQLLGRMGLNTHYHAFYRVWDREYLTEVNCGRRKYWEAMRSFLLAAGLTNGQVDEVMAAGHARWRFLQETIRPLPGVVQTISRLDAAGVPLGILSNSFRSARQLARTVSRLQLGGRFQFILSSIDLGRSKPDADCYLAALAALHLSAEQVAFVGHDGAELAGAAKLGMPTVAINHTPDAKADVYLDRIDQLLSMVQFRCRRRLAG